MKKFLIITFITLTAIGLHAQPGGGGGRGGRPGGPPRGERTGQRPPSFSEEKVILEHFPEIPDLTLEQREKVGTILTKEMKEIGKQMDKKRDIERSIHYGKEISEKDKEKSCEKSDKIDKELSEITEKSNKKIEKILSGEQYIAFLEKRNDFKFKRQGGRPHFRDGVQPEGNMKRPQLPPDNEGFE